MYYWFTNVSGSIIIVSPYYEGKTLFSFVREFEPLQEDIIYQIFG